MPPSRRISRPKRKVKKEYPKWRLECMDVTRPKIEKLVRKNFGVVSKKVTKISVKRAGTWESGRDLWVNISVGYAYLSWKTVLAIM